MLPKWIVQTVYSWLSICNRGLVHLLHRAKNAASLYPNRGLALAPTPLHNRPAHNHKRLSLLAFSILLSGSAVLGVVHRAQAQAPVAYYVDCSAGKDGNPGTSPALAWKSINKANNATLRPGDSLLFKRGCAWQGPLRVTWSGTANQPITIGAYGSGNLPKIQDSYSGNVQISGSHLIIQHLETTLTTPPNPDPKCMNQPVAWKVGFSISGSASYNTLQYIKASNLAIGVFLDYPSHHNKVLHSELVNNHVVWQLDKNQALGAMGILLHGDHQEIAYNTFANNSTICTYNGIVESNSIELHGASYANIHHNISYNDRVFSELGSSSTYVSTDNVYAYNLHIVEPQQSNIGSRFIVTRGANHAHGPVWRTKAYNNTLYHTGADSKGITCQSCGTDVLTAKNNIFWVDREPISVDGPFVEGHNLYWASGGNPLINFVPSTTSRTANPLFVDPAAQNFRIQAASPARQAGSNESITAGYTQDLDNISLPQGGTVDMGVYEVVESGGGAPAPTPEPEPEPEPQPIVDCSISINDGALYTGLSSVRVKAHVTNGAQMMVSNDAGFTGATWQPYQPEFDWILRDTEGRIATLVVYVRVIDGAQAPLCGPSHLSDDIIYDPVAPQVSVALAEVGAATAETETTEGGGAQDSKIVSLAITAQDQENGSGVAQMQISPDPSFEGEVWQPYAPAATTDAKPGQTIYVRVQDGAGNISNPASVTIPGADAATDNRVFIPYVSQ